MSYVEGSLKSRPWEAMRSIFDSPNWVGNLLWLSIAALLNSVFVGQIGVFGYGSECIARRAGLPGTPTVDIDPDRLGDYITKGIWPFIVQFVASLVVGIVTMIPTIMVLGLGMAVGGGLFGEEGAGFGAMITMPIVLLMTLFAFVLMLPFLIHAMVCQDFQKAFDFGWAMGFVKIMFWEVVISGFVFGLLTICVYCLGMLMFCVGAIPASGVISGGAMNLIAQWYEIYLERGGVPATPAADAVIDATVI